MADDSASGELLAELWDLVEDWSSTAIQRAREAATSGTTEVADAEIRVLVAHAAELRGAIEAHLARAEAAVADPVLQTGQDEPGDDVPSAQEQDEPAELEPAQLDTAPQAAPAPQDPDAAPPHRCNSADFDRPPCSACGGRHWYCTTCGARQDECAAS